MKCPECSSVRVSTKTKSFYRDTGKPVSNFVHLFGGGFMALLGIAVLLLTIVNWSTSPSLYLLVSGLALLGAGAPQLVRYFKADKYKEIKYKCFDCGHQWEESEE